MAILHLLLAFVAVLCGFVGLVVIIKGFVDKSNKKIWLGTFLVCIMLIISVSGVFCLGKRALNSKRYHDKEQKIMIDKCVKECGPDMMKGCCPGMKNDATDSTEKEIVTKIIVN